MVIRGIDFGCYGKLTCYALSKSLGLNGSLTAVTCQVEKIRWNDDTIASTIALTEK